MKKNKSTCLFLLLGLLYLFLPNKLWAQDYAFKILAENGSIKIHSGEEWKPITPNATLSVNDVVKLEEGAYLGLVHASGKTLALDKQGTYEIAHLNARFKNNKSGIATKYANLYIQNMQSGAQKQSATPPVATTAERAVPNSKLKVLLPNSVDVFSPEVVLRWNDKDTLTKGYEVVFKNMFDEVIMTKETQETRLMLDFSEQAIAQERLVIVSVNAKQFKDIQSSNYGIKHMTPEEAEPIERELKELKLEIAGKENALDKLILASFYEQNNLLADALTNYEYAISLAPHVQAFKTAYDQFIFRNGLGY